MNKFFSPNLDQPVLDQLKAKVLVLRRLVLGKGVVHVEAIELYLVQPQGTIDKNPVLVRPALSWAEQAGGGRGRGAWT